MPTASMRMPNTLPQTLTRPGLIVVEPRKAPTSAGNRKSRPRIHFESLLGLAGIVIPPQPNHLLRKLSRTLAGIVSSLSETEVEIVLLEL